MARAGVVISLEHLIKQPNKLPMLINRKFVFNYMLYQVKSSGLIGFSQCKYRTYIFFNNSIQLEYRSLQFKIIVTIRGIMYINCITKEDINFEENIYHRSCKPETFEWFSNFIKNLKTTDIFVIIRLLVEECKLRI
jgi:hypothetical protein